MSGSCIAHVYYCFHIRIHTGSLLEIAIKIFSLVYLHFGEVQSNTFTERIAKISTNLKTNSCMQLSVGPYNGRQYECERALHYPETPQPWWNKRFDWLRVICCHSDDGHDSLVFSKYRNARIVHFLTSCFFYSIIVRISDMVSPSRQLIYDVIKYEYFNFVVGIF